MRVKYIPTGKTHTITAAMADQWRKAGFHFEIIEADEKPQAIKDKEVKKETKE